MARTNDFPRVLWLVTSAWLAGCGRIGFGEADHGGGPALPDAPDIDAPAVIKGPPAAMVAVPQGLQSVCGDQKTTAMASVMNTGETDLVITKIAARDGVFGVNAALPLTIKPGEQASVELIVPAAVLGTDIGGHDKQDVLQFTANVAIADVDVATKVMGANLQVIVPAAPAPLTFTGTSGLCPNQKSVTIRNAGNMAATMTTVMPATFVMSGASSASMAAGASTTISVRPFSLDTGACSGVGVIEYELSGAPNCSSSTTTGTALNATYTISPGGSSCFCS